jgi:hypothetical protein
MGGPYSQGSWPQAKLAALKAAKNLAASRPYLFSFLLKKYGAGASRLAAAEEVVCEGEKTREERDAELRGEAVSLDE